LKDNLGRERTTPLKFRLTLSEDFFELQSQGLKDLDFRECPGQVCLSNIRG